ncbi:PREDICTED: uncharacterized protein LOC109584242 [Amphimedon queenslandica]|uniref:Inositol 1,4,5-trisphosphate/ryanodine receptor domain-containing protein n=1 Tax=Amphimedon queenslandica TaxID=400682 RepID=A0AAN0JFA8_AMPQE|nr:PREDICTED: uncharacterized protein LOC109584242 [Amphimedon queenslandica]|eukprot:XP_019855476.1 PREDICTED: uncharacterized protein LOC109584242 [Amphimedon queenslandica]
MATPGEVLDGDIVLIHSPDTSGLVYSKSFSSNQSDFLTIESQKNNGFVLEFAAFCIIQRKQRQKQSCQNATSQLMEIVYGSTIKLQHSFSRKYLTVVLMENKQILCLKKEDDENNNLFKIVPFHQEKGWGESLKVDDRFKLESMSCKGQKIKFQHKPDEKCYRPGLDNDGTMFYIEFHCHNNNNAELDPNCIKGGSIVTLASTEVDGYLSARGSLLTCETPRKIIKEYKIGLRRWQRGFFNTKPNSGDTFFQLESIDAKTNKGSNLLSFGKCRIKHLATQQYISATKDEEIKLESNASLESVQFEILTLSDKKEKEICYSDKVALMHTATKKFLSFNAILEEGDLIHWSDLILKEETASFKAIQVDEVAVQDAYQIVGMSSALYEVFEKMGTNDEAQAKVVKIMEELQDLFFSASNENPSSLKKIFDTPQRKTRLANMLRTCQMIDVMIVFLREEVKKDGSNLSLIESICSSLQLYVENGSERSMQYLVKEKEFLMDMVGKCSNADEVLITLFNKYKAFDHKDCTTLIEKIGIEDSEVLALMCTLAFNGRSIDWSLYKNINEKLKGKISEDVHQTLEGFATEVQYLDKNGTTTFTICSTCVCLIIEASNRIIEAEKYSQAPLNYGQSLKRCIQEIEKKNQECLVLVQLMNVLVFLIDYGVVDKSMEKDFTKSIMKLSGKTGQGHQCSAAIIVKIRKLALLSLKLLLQQNFDASFKVLLNDFCYLNNTISETDHDLPKDSSNIPMSSIGIQSQPDECPPKEMEMLLADKEITDKQVIAKLQARLKQNFNCFSMFNVKTDECQKLCRILIDGFADDDTKIRIMSAELLYGIFSVEETILSETAERTYFTLNKELYTEMKRLATMTDEDQLLRKMLRRELTPDSTDNLQKELERIADVCVLEDGTPNTISQNIGYSCGLFNIVLECVLEQKGQKNYEILKSCFTLLQKMSRKNKKAQNKLFISFHDFLQTKSKELMRPMICLLNEIFFKNPDICQKLTEADIDNIFSAAISNIGEHMELTVTLRIIIESTNPALPLKEHVARLIQHHSKNGALSFILEKDTRKHLIVDGYVYIEIIILNKILYFIYCVDKTNQQISSSHQYNSSISNMLHWRMSSCRTSSY